MWAVMFVRARSRTGWFSLVDFAITKDGVTPDAFDVASRLWDVPSLSHSYTWEASPGYADREDVVEVAAVIRVVCYGKK